MSTEAVGGILAERKAQFEQRKGGQPVGVQVFTPVTPKIDGRLIAVKPTGKTWDELLAALEPVLDKEGQYRDRILVTVRNLYDQGYCCELETAAELATELATKKPASHYFAASVSKRSGNWEKTTLKKVHEVWEVRRNALEALEGLGLGADQVKQMLALAWKLKGTLIRFLNIAKEKGKGIRNPVGLFLDLTAKAVNSWIISWFSSRLYSYFAGMPEPLTS